jgi:hypothetical protein
MSVTCFCTCNSSPEIYPTFTWSPYPNHCTKCAYSLAVDPGYSSDWRGTLLTFPGEIFPLGCPGNVSEALVLLLVSTVRVVLGLKRIWAVAMREGITTSKAM